MKGHWCTLSVFLVGNIPFCFLFDYRIVPAVNTNVPSAFCGVFMVSSCLISSLPSLIGRGKQEGRGQIYKIKQFNFSNSSPFPSARPP